MVAAVVTVETTGVWVDADEGGGRVVLSVVVAAESCVAVVDGKSEADGEDALLAGFASSTGWEPCRVRLP